jgi:hypothetical protein
MPTQDAAPRERSKRQGHHPRCPIWYNRTRDWSCAAVQAAGTETCNKRKVKGKQTSCRLRKK